MKALRRYLASDGRFGEVPVWYTLVSAARYLRVAPWDLAQRPAWWVHVALAAQAAEGHASEQKAKRKERSRADGGRT